MKSMITEQENIVSPLHFNFTHLLHSTHKIPQRKRHNKHRSLWLARLFIYSARPDWNAQSRKLQALLNNRSIKSIIQMQYTDKNFSKTTNNPTVE